MASGRARLFIRRPAIDVIEFIMDLRQYQKVDRKLGKIYSMERNGDEVVFRFRPKLFGLPGPTTTQRVVLTDGKRIDVVGIPMWTDAMVAFGASFMFEEENGGTWVTRNVEFRFARAVSWLLAPVFTRWLAKDVPAELAAAKSYLESHPS